MPRLINLLYRIVSILALARGRKKRHATDSEKRGPWSKLKAKDGLAQAGVRSLLVQKCAAR